MSEAKELLGFDETDNPTKSEVSRAWKKKIFEFHPDRGGDHSAAVEINAARDILEGKARPTYERGSPRPSPAPKYEPPRKSGTTFDEAVSKAGIPHGTEWHFATESQRGKGWSGDESSMSDRAWVAYGRTESKHVFVGVRHYTRQDYYVGGIENRDEWTIKSEETPLRDLAKEVNPRFLYGNVVKTLKRVGFGGRFNSKVIDSPGKSGTDWLSSAPRGSATSIKHWLVNSGQLAGDDPSVVGRKQTVQIIQNTTRAYGGEVKPGYYPEAPARWNTHNGEYMGEYYKITLRSNGKDFLMSEDDFLKFSRLKLGGKRVLDVIFGRYSYDESKKMLTRIRAGKVILAWMSENLHLPSQATEALAAAAAQMPS